MNNNELTAFLERVHAEWMKPYVPSKRKVRRQRIEAIIPRLSELAVKALNRTLTDLKEIAEYHNLYQEYRQLCDEQLADEQRRHRKT